MKVIVPYANDTWAPEVHHCVRLNLDLLGIEAEWVRMHEPNDYAILLNRLWDEREKFVIVEHDVIPWRGAIEEIWECEHPFCCYDGTFQCVKFEPEHLGDCPVESWMGWTNLDAVTHTKLHAHGVLYHEHCPARPQVTNLNRHDIPKKAVG